MSLPDSHSTRKHQNKQESSSVRPKPSRVAEDKHYVTNRMGGPWIAIPVAFIRSWVRVLHPLSFGLFNMLQTYAEHREGPNYGHTGRFCTREDLRKQVGTNDHGLTRAFRELAAYRLIEYAEPNA